jgi:hypothetical protein
MWEVSDGDSLVVGEVLDIISQRLHISRVLALAIDIYSSRMTGVADEWPQLKRS